MNIEYIMKTETRITHTPREPKLPKPPEYICICRCIFLYILFGCVKQNVIY